MAFNLKTLLYVFALTAVALAVVGAWGVLAALVILLLRAIAWRYWEYGLPLLPWCIVTMAIFAVAAEFLLPSVQGLPWPRHLGSYRHIYNVADDMLYLAENESKRRGVNSQHSHSWRSDVWDLEFREGLAYDFSGPGIDFTQPWEKAASASVLPQNPFATLDYRYTGRASTDLLAVIDTRTVWVDNRFFDFARATDPLHQTILIIEADGYDIQFTEPYDLKFEEAVEVLSRPIRPGHGNGHVYKTGFFFHDVPFRHIVTCDGCVHRLYEPMPREVAVAVLTARGGERVDLDPYTTIKPRLDWGRVWSVAALVALAIIPGRWLLHVSDEELQAQPDNHSDER